MSRVTKHRWGKKTVISLHKAERECQNGCGIIKVSRYEFEGGRDKFWTEYWRDLDRIECKGTPACEPVARTKLYEAREYPL